MNGSGTTYLQALRRWVIDEAKAKKGWDWNPNDWLLISREAHVPQQGNGYDCGVFTYICADYLTDDLPLGCYGQEDMSQFRYKMGAAILRGTLNYSVCPVVPVGE